MGKDIGIIVVAEGIDQETRDRFEHHLKCSKQKCSYDLLIMGGTERKEKFYKTRLLNEGLEKMFKENYRCIIQTDIDLIIPKRLIDMSVEEAERGRICYHTCMRRTKLEEISDLEYDKYPWQEWKKYRAIYASGCWNAMTPETWLVAGKFAHNIHGWGYDDTLHRRQAIENGVKWKDNYRSPLMHIDHPKRNKDNRINNRKEWQNERINKTLNWSFDHE